MERAVEPPELDLPGLIVQDVSVPEDWLGALLKAPRGAATAAEHQKESVSELVSASEDSEAEESCLYIKVRHAGEREQGLR